MSFDAGSVTSTLGIDINPFAQGMLESSAIAHLFPGVVSEFLANPLLGLIGIAERVGDALKESISGVTEEAHQIGIEAARAGVSFEFMENLAADAKVASVGMEEVAQAMAFLGRNAAQAASGSASDAAAFNAIGISVLDMNGHLKDGEQLFRELADAIAHQTSGGKQAQIAMDLLSRSGASLLPILKGGSAGFDAYAARLKAASGGIDESLVNMSMRVAMTQGIWEKAWFGIRQVLAQPFLAFATAHAEAFENTIINVAGRVRHAIEAATPVIINTITSGISIAQNAFAIAAADIQQHAAIVKGAIIGMATAFTLVKLPAAIVTIGRILGVVAGVLGSTMTIAVVLGAAIGGLAARFGLLTYAWQTLKSVGASFAGWATGVAAPALRSVFAIAGVISFMNALKSLANLIAGQVVTTIKSELIAALAFLSPVMKGFGSIVAALVPLLQLLGTIVLTVVAVPFRILWGIFTAIASVIGSLISGGLFLLRKAFEAMTPVLRLFGSIIGGILDKLATMINFLGRAARAVTDFLHITSKVTAAPAAAVAAASPTLPVNAAAPATTAAMQAVQKTGDDAAKTLTQTGDAGKAAASALDGAGGSADVAAASLGDLHQATSDASGEAGLPNTTLGNIGATAQGAFSTGINAALAGVTALKDAISALLAIMQQLGTQMDDIASRAAAMASKINNAASTTTAAGGGGVVIQFTGPLNVGPIDAANLTEQVAAKIRPFIESVVNNLRRDAASAAGMQGVRRGLGLNQ